MTAMVLTAPILPGKVEAWRRFCQEINGRRRREYERSRRQLGIASEAVWLLRTARADIAVVRLDADEPEHLLSRLAASDQPFDRWFKERLHAICGLDLNPALLGPTMELIFTWQQSSVVKKEQ
ncbi:MAG: hypothetical protein R3272_09745 [Candidatus Promineifilaceae bacterium]|nr:hypothetical protein [Candidatus Promineifilaceae bacterium]